MAISKLCKCGKPRKKAGRYCLDCHNAYMREWRKTHRLTPEQRKKDNARSHAGIAFRRGQIAKQSCNHCGCRDSEMHHPDYDQPLLVVWLCRLCHLAEHKRLKQSN